MLNFIIVAQEGMIAEINKLLDEELDKDNVHNVFFSIYSPTKSIDLHSVKGSFSDGSLVSEANPFYTASIGKTFTATTLGILVDRGKLHFDDPISKYLPDEIMDGLHILNGVDYKDSIRLSHLLQHTSGLPDYFNRETIDGSTGIFDLIMTDKEHFWQPSELIQFSKAHFRPNFAPGKGYLYTDTEYVLLGMIIEEVSKMPLHDFFAKEIFEPLSMNSTYLNLRSTGKNALGKMAELYAGGYEISTFKSLSADWAGGAIISTGKDLIRFQIALFGTELVSEETLNKMQEWTYETVGMTYGYGLRKIKFSELDPSFPNLEVIGHSGSNGTSMYYCPDEDIYLVGTLNQLESSKDAVILLARVLEKCTNF
ncbi:serine hydrolase [Mangrovivirga cuniculi]|uniref:Serine hydrolase n=2 Tax=Mangrovivirga cuniculi TaxID=2715131 RepID=A0A4D7JRD5_9BACT|nr:serine hydrolase [Mangrovivirga cuniculi]